MIARRLILAAVLLAARIARADESVALLPLDADKGLEIYGQPVAGAIAKALEGDKVTVIVVGANMNTEGAALIVAGRIARGPGGSVILTAQVRVNGQREGVDVKPATAPSLTKIDAAAADLSARVVPVVRDKLAHLPPPDHGHVISEPPAPPRPPAAPVVVIAVADWTKNPAADPLKPALDASVGDWVRAQHREMKPIDHSKLDPKLAAKAVSGANAELAVGLWILEYHTETVDKLPVASARVHVRVADTHDVVFDRVIVTDTVLGDPKLAAPELAARVAREVLAILRPHMRHAVPSWH